MVTSDDLHKVEQGHGQVGFISDFVYDCCIFNRSKSHINFMIPQFFLYYYYRVTFDDLTKVK